MANIWKNLPHPAVLLAPMEGVTDIMFRQVVARAGDLARKRLESANLALRPDLFFTEFTNVSSYASEKGRANALERLAITPSDRPIIAQVWGKEPAHFAETVAALKDLGFSGVDLNYGCPDRHVNKAGGGAAMIQNPSLARECLQRAKEATKLPVSVKTRLGWSRVEEFREWLPILLKEHPAALTVHLRTKKEMSKVPAHYEIIPEIVKLRDEISPETKLVVNGDIRDRLMALEMSRQFPEVDGYMIGRGVMQNPFCFVGLKSEYFDEKFVTVTSYSSKETGSLKATSPKFDTNQAGLYTLSKFQTNQTGLAALLEFQVNQAELTNLLKFQANQAELTELLKFHLALYEKEREKRYISYETLKHFFKIYVNNFPGAAEVRMKLMDTHDVAAAKAVLALIA